MRHPDKEALRDEVRKAITFGNLNPGRDFLSFSGILPLNLPDGFTAPILPDMHIPAHRQGLIPPLRECFYHLNRDEGIDGLWSIGDLLDMNALARHPKDLRVVQNPQWEFEEGRRVWVDLFDASGAKIGFILLGNHEDRQYRYLQDMAPLLGGLVHPDTREPFSFHAQMGFGPDDPVTFIYGTQERGGFEGGVLINNDLSMHHGILVRPKPGVSPLADMDKWARSIVHGHTHRLGFAARNTGSVVLRGYEIGNLVDMEHSFMAYARNMWPNWMNGFAILRVWNGVCHLQIVPMLPVTDERGHTKLAFTVNGRVYYESER